MKRALVDSFGGYGRMATLVLLAVGGGMALAWSSASAAQHIGEEFGFPSSRIPGWMVTVVLMTADICLLVVLVYLATRLLERMMKLRTTLSAEAWAEVRRVAGAAPDCETAERWLGGPERLAKLSRRAGLPVGNCQAWLKAVRQETQRPKSK